MCKDRGMWKKDKGKEKEEKMEEKIFCKNGGSNHRHYA